MGGKNSGIGTKPTDISKRYRADFIQKMDGRVTAVKALHERFNALASDLGGLESLSFQEQSLCKRIVFLERHIERMELIVAKGGTVEVHAYIASINALAGLLSKIGLRRRAKKIPPLHEYIEARKQLEPTALQQAPQSTEPQPSKGE
ncbi:MAG: hypothetical protein OJF51_000116 [Nitrospira sp.]|jgi:hypothetical protein|nr:MAG: hypothetical protein OJF51_000116 [Nitrospira sp.]